MKLYTDFVPDTRSRADEIRDRVVVSTVNWLLNHLATKWYRDRITALMLIAISRMERGAS